MSQMSGRISINTALYKEFGVTTMQTPVEEVETPKLKDVIPIVPAV